MTTIEEFADPLAGFSDVTRSWFRNSFQTPTKAQAGAWQAIQSGQHALVVAPTGSGKTLAAFLSAIDQLTTKLVPTSKRGSKNTCRVLYISPLKALAADVERNLRSPLVGIRREAELVGATLPDISVAIRTGDTPANERRKIVTHPPDILITTPESLYLMLTSSAREMLRGIQTVIIDEIHAIAGTKRGAHLGITLERLDALLPQPMQRIGLSATVQPIDEVALFLTGRKPCTVINPPSEKQLEIDVIVPVEDLAMPALTPTAPLDAHSEILEGAADQAPSIWPHLEQRITEQIKGHTSTLVFANSRRLAERLTARINELESGTQLDPEQKLPADLMGQAGATHGARMSLARAHHGSVSKEQRALIEDDLKAGRLPAVVATSSLELGIDMGSIDLVIQVEAPPSVASGLQRIGRAGHQVGEVSRASFYPKHRGDLVACAVVADLMNKRRLEPTSITRNALDVLAQQVVAMVSIEDEISPDEVYEIVCRSAAYSNLPRSAFDGVLDMLSGRYPADGFNELRPRIVWDRTANTLTPRPGAQRLAVTSGGTIPDRGLFGVFMVGERASRVGELDEEMVYESRVGDVFALGATSWRIEDITHDRVLVSPAPGHAGRLPFWHGDSVGRPVVVGRAMGELNRELINAKPAIAEQRLRDIGLDELAAQNLLRYLNEQREATGSIPTDRQLIVERFRDELGDWRIVLLSPFGARVHAPWALAISQRIAQLTGLDAQVMHSDDGIVLRIPDTEDDATLRNVIDELFPDPDEIGTLITNALGGSALFAARFRECAARALLLPRRDPGKRSPLWQQRQRSAQLLTVASEYPSFPIIIETMRECLQDVYDVPALTELLRAIRSRNIEVIECSTPAPSPFARSLLFSYVENFIYEGDSPLAERRAAALTVDTELLSELLGFADLRELLDPDAIAEVEAMVSCTDSSRHAHSVESTADLLRLLGPLSREEWQLRAVTDGWLDQLIKSRRAIAVRINSQERVAAIEDAARLRDALGVALPVGVPDAFLDPVDDPLADLLARYARTHGPFVTAAVAEHFGLGNAIAEAGLRRLMRDGVVVSGEFRPGESGSEWCDTQVLRRIRRKSIAALRREIEPVPAKTLGLFYPLWSSIQRPKRGPDAVLDAVTDLAGAPIPASILEATVLPSRVADYQPAMLDELTNSGEVTWCGRGRLGTNDGWIHLAPIDLAPLVLPQPTHDIALGPLADQLGAALAGGGSWLFRELASRLPDAKDIDLSSALWDLVWSGLITADTLAPIRANLMTRGSGSGAGRVVPGVTGRTRAARIARSRASNRMGPANTLGRWSSVIEREPNPTKRMNAVAQALLNRYGIVTRGAAMSEGTEGGFAGIYRVLSAIEDSGQVRRGYFIEGLGAAQFATAGAVDQLRNCAKEGDAMQCLILATCDPANPYGAAVAWPASAVDSNVAHRPGRKAGSFVGLVNGDLVLYLERGGKSLLTFTPDQSVIDLALRELAATIKNHQIPIPTIERVDSAAAGTSALSEPLESVGFVLTPRGYRLRPAPG